jgi:hypothetical protein
MAKVFKVIVELYDLLITARRDDRFGRVVSTGSLKIDDLITIAIARGSDINAATMKAAYEILKETALEEVRNAKQVEFGLSHYGLGVNGVFIGNHAVWKDGEHSFSLRATTTAEVHNALKEVTAEVRGMAASGIYVNTLIDVASGEINSRLTPGGGVNMTGFKIKIAGDAPEVGIHLTEVNSDAAVDIPASSIPVNEPSKDHVYRSAGLARRRLQAEHRHTVCKQSPAKGATRLCI